MSDTHQAGEPARPPGDAEPLTYSYLAHRKVIGYLGLALPPVLVLVATLRSTREIQTSISVGRGVDTSGARTNQREANGERSGSAHVWPGPHRVRRRRLPAGRGLLRGGVLVRPVVRARAVTSANRGPSRGCAQRAGDSATIRPGVQARQAASSGPGDPERSSVGPPAASAEARSTPARSARGGLWSRPRRYDDPARARFSAAGR